MADQKKSDIQYEERHISVLEDICLRIPILCEKILIHLDDKSSVTLRLCSRNFCAFVQYQRWFWIRIIQKYIGKINEVDDTWKTTIEKAPSEIIKELAISVANVSELYNLRYYTGWSPLHIVALSINYQSLDLCAYLLKKIGSENLKGRISARKF